MIDGKSVLALVPARSGSKGFPGKNTAQFHDRPLIAWPIKAALASSYVDDVIVSTDSEEIAEIARHYGARVPWLRPAELAQDHSVRSDVIVHALESEAPHDLLVYLEPTSPLTAAADIDICLRSLVENRAAKSCVTICKKLEFHPEYCVSSNSDGLLRPFLKKSFRDLPINRQQLSDSYFFDGSVYVSWVDSFLEYGEFYHDFTLGVELEPYKAIEIDEEEDLLIADTLRRKYMRDIDEPK